MPILWSPDVKSRHIGKDPDAGKDWGQKERRAVEEEMVRQHHRLNGHEFERTLIVKDREVWGALVHGVAKSWTRLSNWTRNSLRRQVFRSTQRFLKLPPYLYTVCRLWSSLEHKTTPSLKFRLNSMTAGLGYFEAWHTGGVWPWNSLPVLWF